MNINFNRYNNINNNTMNIEEIKSNWSKTDEILFRTPEIKLASLLAGKTKVIAKN